MITLGTSLSEIPGINQRFLTRLKNLRIQTVKDLLWHFPSRYEDFSQITNIGEVEPGQSVTVQGVVQEVELRHSWQRRMPIIEARVADDSGSIRAVWFNQSYIKNVLRPRRLVNLSGKVTVGEHEIYLSHPIYEFVGRNETKHTARLVPVYPETRGLTSKGLRFLIQPILKALPTLNEWIPPQILKGSRLTELNHALHNIHFPETLENALDAKRRFAFEDLFLIQLLNLKQKLTLAKEKAPAIRADITKLKNIIERLPFLLTLSQKKSLWEIVQDIEKPHPMNRLLQGDVGSGKTVVAALAAFAMANDKHQTAFMAPTEVLARQHFETLKKLFRLLPQEDRPAMGLLTASQAKIFYDDDLEADLKKPDLVSKIKNGEIKIVIGTHALIEKNVAFNKLGLIVIDEQHRFGVEQRATLLQKKPGSVLTPHFLSMSATPIPRTLMLTVFGDLDISAVNEMPVGRKNVDTKVVGPEDRNGAYQFIREQIKNGRQAFVICPRIDPGEDTPIKKGELRKLELKSVKEEYEKLSKQIFPDLRIAMLHGQMKPKEKEQVMENFRNQRSDLLVSTSVIEVGVDIPNASIMMIEGSDRFGLAQLYQFRGRVGRGEHQSYCFLFTDSNSKSTKDRLKAILEAKNGFELAERDLQIRGPGEFIGQKQSGLPDYAMRAVQDIELVKSGRTAAASVLSSDPELKKHPTLKERFEEFKKGVHME